MSAHPAGTSWPPGWSTKVKADPGAQPVHGPLPELGDRSEAAGVRVRAAVDPAPELDPVEDPALDRLVLLPPFERHRVVAPAMGEQQLDRAGAASGLARQKPPATGP